MSFKKKSARIVVIGAMAAAMAVMAGCRESEQGRPLVYQKGTYLGAPDEETTDAQQQALRQRARYQSF
jgi:hypothetical protein